MGLFKRRPTSKLVAVDVAAAPDHHAVARELRSIRDWFEPKVVQQPPDGEPHIWMWVTPKIGLVVLRVPGRGWYVWANGYDANQEPLSFGADPSWVCEPEESPETVAREVVKEHVQHVLATYLSLPPSRHVRPYDGPWASMQMFELAQDGYI